MRPLSLLFLLLPAAALAQAPIERAPAGDPRQNQKIERITIEDAANRIDELRVGGQTQNVTVQPKAGGPAYELPPQDLARDRPGERREGAGRQRVWNLLNF